ncbi:DinB family protein [Paraflavitalea sp. CAU 1676]|uniref:DinB family protein n=1 Tax=Paraflavitalea sp. CAU 1676 TaxID=3032598 RepID=UPI0023DA5773|nr:DinB family protein [Paraflavitalea sp. CAU 1676]MDF2187020.1 DinB family protein [Paraflavitalea sp. CAU 1676]
MNGKDLCQVYLNEIKAENEATRKCLERIPESLFKYKPHEKSMEMGYLTLLVAEIPKWVKDMVEGSIIDFVNYEHIPLSASEELLKHYDKAVDGAMKALSEVTEESLKTPFELRNSGQVLWKSPKLEAIGSTINHWVHHRGQLTVYMRLNDIAVPSIYGPSADDKKY